MNVCIYRLADVHVNHTFPKVPKKTVPRPRPSKFGALGQCLVGLVVNLVLLCRKIPSPEQNTPIRLDMSSGFFNLLHTSAYNVLQF
jgi:hypothetical protein